MSSESIQQNCVRAIDLLNKGQAAESLEILTKVLVANEDIPLAWNNRGVALMQLGAYFDAILNFDRAIALAPQEPSYYNNKGAALFDSEISTEKAIEAYKKAIEIDPNLPETLMNLGRTSKWSGRLKEAIDYYRKAVEANPDYVDAHLNLSFALLMDGQLEEGWKEFEWRWKSDQLKPRGLKIPEWKGEPLHGKTILVYAEQGFGDALQFVRYAPILKAHYNCYVIVEVRNPLVRLIKTVKGIDQVISFGEKIPEGVDYAVSMMSIPRVLGSLTKPHDFEEPVWNGPYFNIDDNRHDYWKAELAKLPPGFRVGICWAGMSRADNPQAQNVDRLRSTTLASFAPAASIKGVSWVSLQKGPPAEQINTPMRGMTIGDWTPDLDDFYDTATLIKELDLVITVDTAVAHLAAALGKPTWILSRWDGCWRWLKDRTDTPWYPSVRLFNQTAPNDWTPVMGQLADALHEFVEQNTETQAA